MAKSSAPRTTNRRSGPAAAGSAPGRSGALVVAIVLAIALAGMALWFVRGRDATAGAVIVVSIDTLRADRLAIYGYAGARTPVTTALAADAVVFDRAYAHAPQTLPSHASMFTGRLPFEHKVRDNLGFTLEPGAVDAGSALQARRVRDRRLRFRLRPAAGDRHLAGLRPLRRHLPRHGGRPVAGTGAAPGQRHGRRGDDVAADADVTAVLPLPSHLRAAQAMAPPDRFADLDAYDGEVAFSDEHRPARSSPSSARARLVRRRHDRSSLSDHGEGLGDHIEEEHGLFLYDEVDPCSAE